MYDLRSAHSDAIQDKNQFAEIVVFNLLQLAGALQSQLKRAVNASDK